MKITMTEMTVECTADELAASRSLSDTIYCALDRFVARIVREPDEAQEDDEND